MFMRDFFTVDAYTSAFMTVDKIPTLAFFLRDENGVKVYEYSPQRSAFFQATGNVEAQKYMASCECWAQDLLAIFEGRFEPRIMTRRHSRWSSHPPVAMREVIPLSFGLFFHPLNRQEQVLRRYREYYKEMAD